MRAPRVSPSWTRAGWEIESAHVPGSYRMLATWAASLAAAVAVTVAAGSAGYLHAGMYAAAVLGVAGLYAGVRIYRRYETGFALPDPRPWAAPLTFPTRPAGASVALEDEPDDETDDAPAAGAGVVLAAAEYREPR